jgi:threonine/homoserine/homoserine lactone efflux protein
VLESVRRFINRLKDSVISECPIVIGTIFALLAGLGFLVLSASIMLVLTPFVIGGVLYIRWRIRKAIRQAQETRGQTVDAEYHIIEIRRD